MPNHTPIKHTLPSGCTGGDSCCAMDNKCGEQGGDCDADSDCVDGLKCGHKNCVKKSGLQWEPTDDCCYKPGRTKLYLLSTCQL